MFLEGRGKIFKKIKITPSLANSIPTPNIKVSFRPRWNTWCKNLINKRHGSPILKQRIWLTNHRSHTKVYFNEVVANTLRGNIGIVNFGLRGYGGC